MTRGSRCVGWRRLWLTVSALAIAAQAGAQLPKQPKNLQVLPKNLPTDSVSTVMLGVADALGVTCGHCHPGGDNATWDSANFTGDVKPTKAVAREMMRLVNRLNGELIPSTVLGHAPVPVTCATCHRGAPRPMTIEDTLFTVLQHQGIDSAVVTYERIRMQYTGRMTFDLSEFPLIAIGRRLLTEKRVIDAVKLLEVNARFFPGSADAAYALGTAYQTVGDTARAMMQYHKVLSIEPGDQRAQRHLGELAVRPPPKL